MKDIKLKKIVLSNWKGQSKEVEFFNKTLIEGKNGSGKTSIANAWYWLLTTYTDANSNPNNELFDNTKELSKDTPKAVVTAHIEIDGTTYILSKSAEAKFTRERGGDVYVKAKSDVYVYKLDNIEISANDFKEWVSNNICDYNYIKYCVNGQFFLTMCEEDKMKSRKILEGLIGEIQIDNIETKYPNIYDKLNTFSIDNIIEATKNEIKPIEERLITIPKLIEQKENLISSFQQYDFESIKNRVQELKNKLIDLNSNIEINENKQKDIELGIKKFYKELGEINSLIEKEKYDYTIKQNSALSDLNSIKVNLELKKTSVTNEKESLKREISLLKSRIEVGEKNIVNLNNRLVELRNQKNKLKEKEFERTGCCPTCGQPFSEEYFDKEEQMFNINKANELEKIINTGKNTRLQYDSEVDAVEKLKIELSKTEEKLQIANVSDIEVDNEINKIYKQSNEIRNNQVKWEDTDRCKELNTLYEKKKNEKPFVPEEISKSNKELKETKESIINEMNTLSEKIGLEKQIKVINDQIIELNTEKQNLGIKIAKLEGIIKECKDYIEEKANIIGSKVNDKLIDCKIQMWNRQKDGNIIPDCIVLNQKGVKYSTMNNADRIKTTLSIQKMFCDHFGISLPIFVDEYSIFDSENAPIYYDNLIALRASDDVILKVTQL